MIGHKMKEGTPVTIRRARASDLPSLIRIFKPISSERTYFVVEACTSIRKKKRETFGENGEARD
jgi:hypothetical protein